LPNQSETAPEKILTMEGGGLGDALNRADAGHGGAEHADEIDRQQRVDHLRGDIHKQRDEAERPDAGGDLAQRLNIDSPPRIRPPYHIPARMAATGADLGGASIAALICGDPRITRSARPCLPSLARDRPRRAVRNRAAEDRPRRAGA